MEDLEKTIDPVLDGAENANPNDTSDGFEINLWDSSPVNEENQDLSEVLSVDATDNTSVTPEESPTNEEITSVEDTEPQTNLPEESLTATPQEDTIESTQEKVVPNLSEALSSVSEPEPVNNEVVLWKFENEMITPKDTSDTPQSFDNSVIEHPAVLDQSPMAEVNAEEQQKAKLAQKAKLELLIKTHESKAQKKWLMTWVLSGVVVTAWVLVLAWVFAKDQVVDVLNTISGESTLSASVTNLWESNTEQNYPDITVDEENSEDIDNDAEEFTGSEVDEFVDEENVDSEDIEDTSSDDSEISDTSEVDEYVDEENVDSEDVEDTSSDDSEISDTSEVDEYVDEENVDENMNYGYSITHVSSEAEANWVMPAHCYDLSCYGEDKEFSPCTTFRLSENLDENAHRIGKNWICKYKDASELVYVEFN